MATVAAPAGPTRRMRRAYVPVVYPAALCATYFLILFVASGASPYSAVRMIVIAALAGLLLTSLAGVLMRDRDRGGLFALTVILLFIAGDDPRKLFALGLGCVALIVERLASGRRPSRIPWPIITRVGTIAAVIAVLTVGIKAGQDGTAAAVLHDLRAEGPSLVRDARPAPAASSQAPDIYVVLLDGYLRPDKQATLFGHDDSEFVTGLESRGFDVASASRSNYLLTVLSLSSALNMRHLDDQKALAALAQTDVRHVRDARHLVNDNEVFRAVHAMGYTTVALSPGFEEVALRQADRFIDTGQINEVELLGLRHSALGALLSVVAPDALADSQRARIDSGFREAARIAAEPHTEPRFVFVHIPSPHVPIVFDANGGHVAARDLVTFFDEGGLVGRLPRKEFGAIYSGQVDYLNKRTLDLVDSIVSSAATPPVVLVMSDHGSASGVTFADLEHSDLDERSSNLFAALTPGLPHLFPDDVTLVNVFGGLLNAYFGTAYPTRPNTVYRWRNTSLFDVVPLPSFVSTVAAP
jgi:hypothetical protein